MILSPGWAPTADHAKPCEGCRGTDAEYDHDGWDYALDDED
ncbi:hypothetical protein [Kitasatospora cineracea]